MNTFKEKYDDLTEQRKRIIERIQEFEESEIIKEYLNLREQNNDLYQKQVDTYRSMKEEEYNSCNHVLVYSKIEHDVHEGRTHKFCGCIKCGLDDSVLNQNRKIIPYYRQIMYDYLKQYYLNQNYLTGVSIKVACDLELAQAIYSRIKEVYPNITDEIAIKYFKTALNNIRNVKAGDERKANMIKRLQLPPNFKNWNDRDVHRD